MLSAWTACRDCYSCCWRAYGRRRPDPVSRAPTPFRISGHWPYCKRAARRCRWRRWQRARRGLCCRPHPELGTRRNCGSTGHSCPSAVDRW